MRHKHRRHDAGSRLAHAQLAIARHEVLPAEDDRKGTDHRA